MGGADITLSDGKLLFDGFAGRVDMDPIRVRQSPFATRITYRLQR